MDVVETMKGAKRSVLSKIWLAHRPLDHLPEGVQAMNPCVVVDVIFKPVFFIFHLVSPADPAGIAFGDVHEQRPQAPRLGEPPQRERALGHLVQPVPAVPLLDQLRPRVHEVAVPHQLDVLDALHAGAPDAVEEHAQLAQAGERERVHAVENVHAKVEPPLAHEQWAQHGVGSLRQGYAAREGAEVEAMQQP